MHKNNNRQDFYGVKTPPSLAKVSTKASYIAAGIILLLPFHAFLTVWLSSAVGHYTLLRLWKEFLLILLVLGTAFILFKDRRLARRLFDLTLTRLIVLYIALLLTLALIPLLGNDVTPKAMWYGLLVDLRFLVFFLAVMVIAATSAWLVKNWPKILFASAALVAAFAVLQYLVLPQDFLRHFGYGPTTIDPYESISRTGSNLRSISTLRGANNLGAYLIIPICALLVMFFREKSQVFNKSLIGFGFMLALIFSFSRSAWLGAALGVMVVAWLSLKGRLSRQILIAVLLSIFLLGTITALALKDSRNFQTIILHKDYASTEVTSSNEGHKSAAISAAKNIADEPFGTGVGTAGPQSVYNDNQGRLAENYFLQIGQEAGVMGMLLFIIICAFVARMLFDRRASHLALALFASLLGITFVNLLSHAWTDDTLAYIWWGLAGVALAPILTGRQSTNGKNHKT